jgi:acetyl-CoA carboxylase biotin carboxyl carrier protein
VNEASVELEDVKSLLKALENTSVTELEWQAGEARVRICRGSGTLAPPADNARAAAPTPTPSAGRESAEAPAAESGLETISSPIVGTFYRSPDPTSPAFVSVGDHVRVGQVLCIVEAMKLMNEIEAEVAGEIVKVHPESGQPVQYGDALFTLRPDR